MNDEAPTAQEIADYLQSIFWEAEKLTQKQVVQHIKDSLENNQTQPQVSVDQKVKALTQASGLQFYDLGIKARFAPNAFHYHLPTQTIIVARIIYSNYQYNRMDSGGMHGMFIDSRELAIPDKIDKYQVTFIYVYMNPTDEMLLLPNDVPLPPSQTITKSIPGYEESKGMAVLSKYWYPVTTSNMSSFIYPEAFALIPRGKPTQPKYGPKKLTHIPLAKIIEEDMVDLAEPIYQPEDAVEAEWDALWSDLAEEHVQKLPVKPKKQKPIQPKKAKA
jgi:hypothetical protein